MNWKKEVEMEKTKIILYYLKEGHYLHFLYVGTDEKSHVRQEHDHYELLKEIDQQEVENINGYDVIGLCLPFCLSLPQKLKNEVINKAWDLIWFDGPKLRDVKFLSKKILLEDIIQKGLRQAVVDALEVEEK